MLGARKPQALSDWRTRPSPRPHPAHPPWAWPPPRQPRTLPASAMVPWPCRADGAGSQAAPSAALGPAPLAAQEAAAQDQPDLSACPWSWLWPQAGLGEFALMSWPGCGPWSRCLGSQFGLHWLWPLLAQAWPCWVIGPFPDLLPGEVRSL